MQTRAITLTSDNYLWALRPFAHLWQKYFDPAWPVVVAGFSLPDFDLPQNFEFISIGAFKDYPVQRWSDAVIKLLRTIPDQQVMLFLEDYWLCRQADVEAVDMLGGYVADHPDVLRMDLTYDRNHSSRVVDVDSLDRLDIVQAVSPAPYQMSTMPGIWNKAALLDILEPGLTPWQVEVSLTPKVNNSKYRVLGTRQWPVRFILALRGGDPTKLNNTGTFATELGLSQSDMDELRQYGYLPA